MDSKLFVKILKTVDFQRQSFLPIRSYDDDRRKDQRAFELNSRVFFLDVRRRKFEIQNLARVEIRLS